jgi:hypothetical protein
MPAETKRMLLVVLPANSLLRDTLYLSGRALHGQPAPKSATHRRLGWFQRLAMLMPSRENVKEIPGDQHGYYESMGYDRRASRGPAAIKTECATRVTVAPPIAPFVRLCNVHMHRPVAPLRTGLKTSQ